MDYEVTLKRYHPMHAAYQDAGIELIMRPSMHPPLIDPVSTLPPIKEWASSHTSEQYDKNKNNEMNEVPLTHNQLRHFVKPRQELECIPLLLQYSMGVAVLTRVIPTKHQTTAFPIAKGS